MNNKMPLVIFNYVTQLEGGDLNKREISITLPEDARRRSWTLRAVNATYVFNAGNDTDFRHLELDFPELLSSENILHSSKSVGNVSEPSKSFRFYPIDYALNEDVRAGQVPTREHSVFKCVSEYPNWNFGEVDLDTNQLTMVVSARAGNVSVDTFLPLQNISVILSYD